MNTQPWSFSNSLFVLKECDDRESPRRRAFSFTLFWIQMYSLPPARMSTAVGKYLGSQVDKCLEVETDIIVSLAGGSSFL
ncbi:hypothetical protein TorRG33x02_355910, partial [Trema orientale]